MTLFHQTTQESVLWESFRGRPACNPLAVKTDNPTVANYNGILPYPYADFQTGRIHIPPFDEKDGGL
jgi:hypothetical protein